MVCDVLGQLMHGWKMAIYESKTIFLDKNDLKRPKMVILEKKIIFNHALRITFWVRYYFHRNKKNAKRSLAPIGFVTIISVSKVRPQALRIKNQFKKSISSRNREIFEFKWERNWLLKNLDPALYRVGFDIMFKNI